MFYIPRLLPFNNQDLAESAFWLLMTGKPGFAIWFYLPGVLNEKVQLLKFKKGARWTPLNQF